MKKKPNKKKEEQKVYVKRCTLCGKKFNTCNKTRSVCDTCCETPSKIMKIETSQMRNSDGISFTKTCAACGRSFVTVNETRIRCTSCVCDDNAIDPQEVETLFKIGNETNCATPQNLFVQCFVCKKSNHCMRRRVKPILGCPYGEEECFN